MEKLCIELIEVEVAYQDRLILDIPRLAVHQFDRIGIVGRNGAGKSTLLKLMAGVIAPDRGHLSRHAEFAYFDQTAVPEGAERQSGGEQTRSKLAQLFASYREGMLIDEPTTHLDAAGIQMLLEELTYYYGALVLVSHDRYVLDQVVTKIWEVQDGRVNEYTGNYTAYTEQKELERRQQEEQFETYVKEKNRLMKAAEEKMKKAEKITQANLRMSKKETKAKANKMFMTKSKDTSQKAVQRAAKAIERRVEQLGTHEAPKREQPLRFMQSPALELHNKFPIMADRLTLTAGNNVLLKEVSFQFPLGGTIAINGKNGSGKTTLLRHIANKGEGIVLSPKAVIGWYEQTAYQFAKDESVYSYIKERSDLDEGKIRAALHAMSFTGNDLRKNVRDVSGGEAIRLELCRLFLGRYNVLLLDEPTNFLDVYCIEALERFIAAYAGTVLLVSHDRSFVERAADRVYDIEDGKLIARI